MHELKVAEDQSVRWLIAGDDAVNRLSSPLRYGQSGPPVTHSTKSTPLRSGFFYNVDLWRIDEEGLPRRVVSQRFLHQVE
jgi:hypothetical protein